MLRVLLLAGLTVLPSCFAPPLGRGTAEASRQGHLTVVNVMPRFWQFLDSARAADSLGARGLFRRIVVASDTAVYAGFTGGPSDQSIDAYLPRVRRDTAAIRAVDAHLTRLLPAYVSTFDDAFPEARWDGVKVYVMPWLYIADGGSGRLTDGTQVLIFGVETIAQRSISGIGPFVHHELFHVLHGRAHPDLSARPRGQVPLFWALWQEGLASYISERLHPAASLGAVLLDSTLAGRVQPRLPALAADLLARLDSLSPDVHRDYLSGTPRSPGMIPRSGYYVGLLVARQVARGRTTGQLLALRGETLRREIEVALRNLAR